MKESVLTTHTVAAKVISPITIDENNGDDEFKIEQKDIDEANNLEPNSVKKSAEVLRKMI